MSALWPLSKELLGVVSALIAVGVTIPYLWLTLKGKIKPHVYTWLIWSLTTGIAALARTLSEGGAGAWAQWASAASCILVTLLALSHGEKIITRGDKTALFIALLAIPVWLVTHNAFYAVAIVTCIDLVGYYPTFRKSYNAPHQEAVFNFAISNMMHILSTIALAEYSWTNILFQGAAVAANTLLIGMILVRRWQLRHTQNS